MKNIVRLILTFCILISFSCNQIANSQALETVKKTLQAKYSGENDPDWEINSNGNFESHFKTDGIKYRADFKPNGDWIESENSIEKKDLPKAIRDKIEADFDGEISEIEKVEHYLKGVFYDVEFKHKGKSKDIEFKADGTIIN